MGLAGSLIYYAQNAQTWDLKQTYFQWRFYSLCSRLSPLPGGTSVTDRKGGGEGKEGGRQGGRKEGNKKEKKERRTEGLLIKC